VSVGELLVQYRESVGKSLEEVALATRISLDILKLIESDDQDYYQKDTLARNFVYTYARVIGADTRKILDTFDAKFLEEKEVKRSLGDFDNSKSFWSSKWFLYGLPIVAVICLMLVATNYIHSNFQVDPMLGSKSKEQAEAKKDCQAKLDDEQIAVWLSDSTDYVGEYILSRDNPMNVPLNP